MTSNAYQTMSILMELRTGGSGETGQRAYGQTGAQCQNGTFYLQQKIAAFLRLIDQTLIIGLTFA